ncbi:hypothetical protein PGIGA_G00009590, partial [Pangasianodon gigas]|nr:hypothetical protein [Pangasianodon gigas]
MERRPYILSSWRFRLSSSAILNYFLFFFWAWVGWGGVLLPSHISYSISLLIAAIPEGLMNTTCLLSCNVVFIIGLRSGLLLVPFSDCSLAQTCCCISN